MTDLPPPLVPRECDLRRMEFVPMPARYLQSGAIAYEPDARVYRCVLALMAFSWSQKPAASFKDYGEDRMWRIAYETPQWWRRHGAKVLSYFVKCSDGRYYHAELAKMATAEWERRNGKRRLDVSQSEWLRLRSKVFARDEYRCVYCFASDRALDCDHVNPLSAGGASNMDNLVTACFVCNRSKGSKSLDEWAGSANA